MSPCFPAQLRKFPFTQEEIGAIWRHAKANYIDLGVHTIEDTIGGTAKDLGLKYEWVARAFAEPKSLRPITMEAYARMSDHRAAIRHAKDAVRGLDEPHYKAVLHAIQSLPQALAVYGHGTVGMITHAGANIFRPTAWFSRNANGTLGGYWPNFGRQFKLMGSKGFHQALMSELVNRDNFVLGKRAGLANDPFTTYEDYSRYAKYFGVKWGKRGFDALKLQRQDMFDKFWQKVPEEIKSDQAAALDMARNRATAINHATGAITSRDTFLAKSSSALDPVLFAARLEASRWARVIGDPIKTVDTFANWKNASAGERSVALTRLGHAAEFTSFYVATLVMNQGLNQYLGSKDQINLTDPSKSDWLKHKIGGHTVAVDGGLLMPIRLLGKLVARDLLGSKKDLRGDSRTSAAIKDVGQYALGKLNPAWQVAKELTTGETFDQRPIPASFPGIVHSLRGDAPNKIKPGKEPVSLGEYTLSHGPIPLAGATKEIYEQFRQEGMSAIDATSILRAIGLFGIESTGAKVQTVYAPGPAHVKLKKAPARTF